MERDILEKLPYQAPFLFVDHLTEINSEGVTGLYTFPEDAFFYKGHFKQFPITPGVILTECAAQIGVVCLGIHLSGGKAAPPNQVALTSHSMDFYLPVYPGQQVKVISKKEYFRFQKLKCQVHMYNSEGNLVCRGSISGMIKNEK